MAYYPYFRGRRFELIAVREQASLMAEHQFVPIISPINEQFRGLERALQALSDAKAQSIVIINPEYGEFADDATKLRELLKDKFASYDRLKRGIRLDAKHSLEQAVDLVQKANGHPVAIIHSGFKHPNQLVEQLNKHIDLVQTHVFVDDHCGKLYREKFNEFEETIIIRDGFKHRPNRQHPNAEFFSENHLTYKTEISTARSGFGDFLTVGDRFSETGGPAYTVAIHLTYIDPEQDNSMYIRHFLSDDRNTPTDPAGKFHQALTHLAKQINSASLFLISSAIKEFCLLHESGHYPGLGRAKQLSMIHHIETMADFFRNKNSSDI